MTRDTLTKGLNHPLNAKHGPRRPTAFYQIRRKGKDSKKPNPRPVYPVRPLRAPRTRGAISASLEGLPPRPSTSASRFRFARG